MYAVLKNVFTLKKLVCNCIKFLLGTPETRRNGLNTRNALSAFMSKPPPFSLGTPAIELMVSTTSVKSLWKQVKRFFHIYIHISYLTSILSTIEQYKTRYFNTNGHPKSTP